MITILLQKILDIIKAYITSLNTKLNQIKNNLSELIIVKTAEGDIASFYTRLARPLQAAKFAIKATGGNGTPSSPIAINGFTGLNVYKRGKNLIDISTLIAGYVNSDGTFNTSQTKGEMRSGFISVKPNTTYYFSIKETSSSYSAWLRVGQYESEDTSSFIQSNSFWLFTTTATTRFIVVSARNLADATKIQLELGNTETDYEPYNSNSAVYPISWQTGAGTVYGGEVDITSGKLKVTHTKLKYYGTDCDVLNLNYGLTAEGYTHLVFAKNGLDAIGTMTVDNSKSNMLSPNLSASGNSIPPSEGYRVINSGTPQRPTIYWYINQTWADNQAFKDWLDENPFEVIVPLATPLEYDLTPQEITALVGVNNIWGDTNGNAEIEYLGKFQEAEPEENEEEEP